MHESGPLVTVNIVTRNRKDALKRAIESVHAQTYSPIEIVVVDNDSSDGTPEMMRTLWPDIQFIQIHMNIGCQPGRNIGMKNCRGKYIFNLDDDGALHPEAIERMVERFEMESDVALIAAAIHPMSEERAHLVKHRLYETQRYVSCFPGGASAIRASVLPETGYFPEYPRGHSEADLGLRILDKHYEMVYLPDVIMYHDVSDIERDENIIMFYGVWHRMETALRLEPLLHCALAAPWRLGVDFRIAVRKRSVAGFLRGFFRFLYELPRIVANRHPISVWTMQKRDFLAYNFVTDGALSRGFQEQSLSKTIVARLRRTQLKTKPNRVVQVAIKEMESVLPGTKTEDN